MTETPRDFVEALGYCWDQHAHRNVPSYYNQPTWHGLCQAFCHEMYGLHTGGFASAFLQWLGADPEDKHVTSNFDNAPAGSLLCTKGSTPFGHIFPAKRRPFADGTPAAMSTDLWRDGEVGPVSRNAAHIKWGHANLGFITTINGNALDLTHGGPPKPKQNKRYQRIENAIQNLGHSLDDLRATRTSLRGALETAKTAHDAKDVSLLQKEVAVIQGDVDHTKQEIARLEHLYGVLRHA